MDNQGNLIYTTIIRFDPSDKSWIAEEITTENTISRAKIFSENQNRTEVTLNFQGPSYEQVNGVLDVKSRTDLPTLAKVMFLNQAAALGVIDWNTPLAKFKNRILHTAKNFTRSLLQKFAGKKYSE